jgi:DNA polymerase elongation subunit (family B)
MSNTEFFIYNWSYTNDEYDGLTLRAYGLNENYQNVYLEITDYSIGFYIELPLTDKTNAVINWNSTKIDNIITILKNIGGKFVKPLTIKYLQKSKLHYFTKQKINNEYVDKTFPFLFLTFKNSQDIKKYTYTLSKINKFDILGKIYNLDLKTHNHEVKINEEDFGVSPIIKYITENNLPSCGWIKLTDSYKQRKSNKTSNFDLEYECSYKSLIKSNKTSIILPKTLIFDYEANSSIPKSMPDYKNPNDKIFQISFVLVYYLQNKLIIQKYGYTLGKIDINIVGNDVIIKEFKTEADLLLSFTEFINIHDPKLITGYNIMGWDLEYFKERCKFLKIFDKCSEFGCIEGFHISKFLEPKFESKAYGAQKLKYFDMEGRLLIDMLPIIKRNYKLTNYKLSTVTTHFKVPTKDDISPAQIFKAYKLYDNNKNNPQIYSEKLSYVLKYCIQDSYCTYLLFNKMKLWFEICEMARIGNVPVNYTFSQGTQIQFLSQCLSYCNINNTVVLSNGYKVNSSDEYLGAIVLDPKPGKYKKVLSFDFSSLYPSIMLAHNICYSRYVQEPPHILISKYNTVEYKNFDIFPAYVKLDYYEYNDVMEITNSINILEQVFDNDEYVKLITELKNKYPNTIIMVSNELSTIPDDECHVFCWEDHSNCNHDTNRKLLKNGQYSKSKSKKIICEVRRHRFVKESVAGKGAVPIILSTHLSERKKARNKIGDNETTSKKLLKEILLYIQTNKLNENNKFVKEFNECIKNNLEYKDLFTDIDSVSIEYNPNVNDNINKIIELNDNNLLLDKTQLALKVNANSIYGAMGVKKGFLPLAPGAMCVTYKGRCGLQFISKYIATTWNGQSVYGDTDSNHVFFSYIKDNESALKLADEIINKLNSFTHFFPKPMFLDFEKVYEEYVILTKKRYIAKVANKKGEIIGITKRGCVLVRRDNCKAVRNLYQKIVDMLLDDAILNSGDYNTNYEIYKNNILNAVCEGIMEIFTFKYNYKTYSITKGLSKIEYKSKTLPTHVIVAKNMNARGVPTCAGMRIEYVLTSRFKGQKNIKQGQKAEDLEYYESCKDVLKLDYLYYLEKQFVKPLDELLNVGLHIKDFVKNLYNIHFNKYLVNKQIFESNAPVLDFEGEIKHIYSPIKIKKNNVLKTCLKQENKQNNDGCKYIFLRGKNSGKTCGKKIKLNDYCSVHNKNIIVKKKDITDYLNKQIKEDVIELIFE